MDEESKEDWLKKKFSAQQLAEKVVAAESESSRLRRRCNELEKRPKASEPASRSESEIKAEGLTERAKREIATFLDEQAHEERQNDPEVGIFADEDVAAGMEYIAARLRGEGSE